MCLCLSVCPPLIRVLRVWRSCRIKGKQANSGHQVMILLSVYVFVLRLWGQYDCLLRVCLHSVSFFSCSFCHIKGYKALSTLIITPWPCSASELYRRSDRHLSAKLVPTFADIRWRVVSAGDPYGRNLCFLDRSLVLYKICCLQYEITLLSVCV
jgi:hypothetical protein